jgi:hypothetical protein
MTPLRREVRLPIYWLVVGLMVMVASPIASVLISVKIAKRTIDENDRARRAQSVAFQVVYCRLVGSQVDVYSEAESEVGKNAYRTWIAEYHRNGCQPPRK